MGRRCIIFDMDGVITSEDGYWRAASCALLDFAAHLGDGSAGTPDPWGWTPDLSAIAGAKALLINTNWDLCHLAALALAWKACQYDSANEQRLLAVDWTVEAPPAPLLWPPGGRPDLNTLVGGIIKEAGGQSGFKLLEALAQKMGAAAPLFIRQGPVWQWLFRRFQLWFNGDAVRPGIIANEKLLLDPLEIAKSLRALHEAGWELGIATGRTREELIPTLARFALLDYFEPRATVTHDEVAQAERELPGTHLSKPHPFPFLRALYPDTPASELISGRDVSTEGEVIVVGDTAADMAAAVAIGAWPMAVMTGPGGARAYEALSKAGAKTILSNMTLVGLAFR